MWENLYGSTYMRTYEGHVGVVSSIRRDALTEGGSFVLSRDDFQETTVAKGDADTVEEAMRACDEEAARRGIR